MAKLSDLLAKDARSQRYLSTIVDLIKQRDPVAPVRVERQDEAWLIVAGLGALTVRFGVPPGAEAWCAEAHGVNDPPGVWFDFDTEGPDVTATDLAVVEYILEVISA